MNKDVRIVAQFASARGPADVRAAADRLLAPKRSKLKPQSKRPAKLAKAVKKETKRDRMSGYHAAVRTRSDGVCELCSDDAVEQHHIIYGSGLRKSMESDETLIDLCRMHHDFAHESDIYTLNQILKWSRINGFRLAEVACEHRIDKKRRVVETTPSLAHRSKRSA